MEQMLEQARNTLQMEADAILELVPRVDEHFSAAVAMILDCQDELSSLVWVNQVSLDEKWRLRLPVQVHHRFISILPKVFTVIWVW